MAPALAFHGASPNDVRLLVAQAAAGAAGLPPVSFVADGAAPALQAGPLQLSSCSAIAKLVLSYGTLVRLPVILLSPAQCMLAVLSSANELQATRGIHRVELFYKHL